MNLKQAPLSIGKILALLLIWLFVSSVQAASTVETQIISGPTGSIGYQNPTFWWSGTSTNQLILGFDYSLNGQTAFTENNHLTFRDLADGVYTLSVSAIAVDGKRDPTPVTRKFQVQLDFQPEIEFNDRQTLANPLSFNRTIRGSSLDKNDIDWFQFSVPAKNNQLTFTLKRTGGTGITNLLIYQQQVLDNNLVYTRQINSANQQFITGTVGLHKGILAAETRYYLKLDPQSVDSDYRPYFLTVSAVELDANFAWDAENNDTSSNANRIGITMAKPLTIVGDKNGEGDFDWFRLHVSKKQNLTISLSRPQTAGTTTINIYRSPLVAGDITNRKVGRVAVNLLNNQQPELLLPLVAGDYFLAIDNSAITSISDSIDHPYFVTVLLNDLDPNISIEVEPNNISPFVNPQQATQLTLSHTLKGTHWNGQTDVDWFQLDLSRKVVPNQIDQPFLLLDLQPILTGGRLEIAVYNSGQQMIGQKQFYPSTSGIQVGPLAVPVSNSKYFIRIQPNFPSGIANYQLTANLVTTLTHSAESSLALDEALSVRLELPVNLIAAGTEPKFDLVGDFSPAVFPERLINQPMNQNSGGYLGTYTPRSGEDVTSAIVRVSWQSSSGGLVSVDLPQPIQIDTVAPYIESIQHDGSGVLSAGDRLTVQVAGDFQPTDQIYIEIQSAKNGEVQLRFPFQNQKGIKNQQKTAILTILKTHQVMDGILTARSVDSAGNVFVRQHPQNVIILGRSPKIELVQHNADRPLKLGQDLVVTLKPRQSDQTAPAIGKGYFQLGNRADQYPLENQNGLLIGTYTVKATDNLFDVAVHVFYAPSNQPSVRISLPNRVTLDGIRPVPIIIKKVTDVAADNGYQLRVEWQPSVDPKTVGYNLYLHDRPIRMTDQPLIHNLSPILAETTIRVDQNSQPYYVAVTAVSQVGNESDIGLDSLSKPVMAVDNRPPSPVAVVSAVDTPDDFGGSVTVSWTQPSRAADFSYYRVHQSIIQPKPGSKPKHISVKIPHPYVTSAEMPTNADLSDHYFFVTAVDLSGNESQILSQSISEPTQSVLNLTNQIGSHTDIEWITTPIGPIRHSSFTFRWLPTKKPFIYYQLDGGRLQPTSSTELTLTGLTVGQHQLALSSEDQQQKVIRRFNVHRSPLSEREPNDQLSQFDVLPIGWQIDGNLTGQDQDIYQLEVVKRGLIDLHWSSTNSEMKIEVRQFDTTIAMNRSIKGKLSLGLDVGSYFIFCQATGNTRYSLSSQFSLTDNWEIETNDLSGTLPLVGTRLDSTIFGVLNGDHDRDQYRLVLPVDGILVVNYLSQTTTNTSVDLSIQHIGGSVTPILSHNEDIDFFSANREVAVYDLKKGVYQVGVSTISDQSNSYQLLAVLLKQAEYQINDSQTEKLLTIGDQLKVLVEPAIIDGVISPFQQASYNIPLVTEQWSKVGLSNSLPTGLKASQAKIIIRLATPYPIFFPLLKNIHVDTVTTPITSLQHSGSDTLIADQKLRIDVISHSKPKLQIQEQTGNEILVSSERFASRGKPIPIDNENKKYSFVFTVKTGDMVEAGKLIAIVEKSNGSIISKAADQLIRIDGILPIPITSPSAQDVADDSGRQVRLAWISPISGVLYYNVYRSMSPAHIGQLILEQANFSNKLDAHVEVVVETEKDQIPVYFTVATVDNVGNQNPVQFPAVKSINNQPDSISLAKVLSEIEPNQTLDTATLLPINRLIHGYISGFSATDIVDYYKLNLPRGGRLAIELVAGLKLPSDKSMTIKLKNNTDGVIQPDASSMAKTGEQTIYMISHGLNADSYLIEVSANSEVNYTLSAFLVESATINVSQQSSTSQQLKVNDKIHIQVQTFSQMPEKIEKALVNSSSLVLTDTLSVVTTSGFGKSVFQHQATFSVGSFGQPNGSVRVVVELINTRGETGKLILPTPYPNGYFFIDTIPPQILKVWHDAIYPDGSVRQLRAEETLKVTLSGESENNAFFTLRQMDNSVSADSIMVPMIEQIIDSEENQVSNYTGEIKIPAAKVWESLEEVELTATLIDSAGNKTVKNAQPLFRTKNTGTIEHNALTTLKLADTVTIVVDVPTEAKVDLAIVESSTNRILIDKRRFVRRYSSQHTYQLTIQAGDNFQSALIIAYLTQPLSGFPPTMKSNRPISADTIVPLPVSNLMARDVPNDNGSWVAVAWPQLPEIQNVDVDKYKIYLSQVPIQSFSGRLPADLFAFSIDQSTLYTSAEATNSVLVKLEKSGVDYHIGLTVVDLAGNESTITTTTGQAVDNRMPPVIRVISAEDTPYDSGGFVTLHWEPTQITDFLAYHIYQSSISITELTELQVLLVVTDLNLNSIEVPTSSDLTPNFYAVVVLDRSGNQSLLKEVSVIGPTQSLDNMVNYTSPQEDNYTVSLVSAPVGILRQNSATFRFMPNWSAKADELTPTIYYRVDQQPYQSATSYQLTFHHLSPGRHTFSIKTDGTPPPNLMPIRQHTFLVQPTFTTEIEVNDSVDQANNLTTQAMVQGNNHSATDFDWFRLVLPINMTNVMDQNFDLYFHRPTGIGVTKLALFSADLQPLTQVSSRPEKQQRVHLFASTRDPFLFLRIQTENEHPNSDYQLSFSVSKWPLNTIAQKFADSFQLNEPLLSTKNGTLAFFGQNSVGQNYTLDLAGAVLFSLKTSIGSANSKLNLKIFSGANSTDNLFTNELTNQIGLLNTRKDQQWIHLSKGSYTLVVSPSVTQSANYQIFVDSSETNQFTEKEPNNTMDLATSVLDLQPIVGLNSDEQDWYRLDLPQPSGWLCIAKPKKINNDLQLELFSADGKTISSQFGDSVRVYGNQVWLKIGMESSTHPQQTYRLFPLFISSVSHNAKDRILSRQLDENPDLVVKLQLAEISANQLTSANFKLTDSSIPSPITHALIDQGEGLFIGRMPIPRYFDLPQGQVVIEIAGKHSKSNQQSLNFQGQLIITEPVRIDTVPPTIFSIQHDAVTAGGLSQPLGLHQSVEIQLVGSVDSQAKFQIRQQGQNGTEGDYILAQGIMNIEKDSSDPEDQLQTYIGHYKIEANASPIPTKKVQIVGILSDLVGNTAQQTAHVPLIIDTQPPIIRNVTFQIQRLGQELSNSSTLLIGDQLIVTLTGESNCRAHCILDKNKFDLYDDGTHGDQQSQDGVYTNIYLITEADFISQAIILNGFLTDLAGNIDNRFADRPITIDTKPPEIQYIQHNATKSLIMGDQLLVYLKGEIGCIANFDIGPIAGVIMVDDGSGKDQKASDGIYTGQYTVGNDLKTEIRTTVVTGRLVDSGGNVQIVHSAQLVTIDAVALQAVTGVMVTDVSNDQGNLLEVSWHAVEGSDFSRYQIYRETAPIRSTLGLIPVPTLLLNQQKSQIQINVPRNGFDYHVAVTAVDVAGNESKVLTSQLKKSTFGPIQAIDNLAPPAIVGVQAEDMPNDNGKVIFVQWQPLPQIQVADEINSGYKNDFQAYHIYRYNSQPIQKNKPELIQNQVPDLVRTIIDPDVYQAKINVPHNRVNYYLSVTAIDENGNESVLVDSSVVGPIQAVDQIPPLPVTRVKISDTPSDSGMSLTVNWQFITTDNEDEIDHYLIILSEQKPAIDASSLTNFNSALFDQPIKVGTANFNQLSDTLIASQQVSIPREDVAIYAAVVGVDRGGNRSELGKDSVAGPVRAVSNYVYPQIETIIQAGFDPKTKLVLPAGVVGSEITTLDILKPDNLLLRAQIEEANFYLGTANIEPTHDDELKPTLRQIDGQIERLSQATELTISFPSEQIPASVIPNLRIFRLNPYGKLTLWELVPGKQTINIEDQTVTANVSQLTVFRVAHLQLPANLDQVVIYPNPFVPAQSINGQVTFLKLTENATVSLYTLDGERVRTKLESTTGRASWDGRNDAGAEVISGLYIYHIEGEGVQKIGQIMIIR